MPHNRCTSSVIATKLCVRLKTLDIKDGHSCVRTHIKSDKNKVHNPGYVCAFQNWWTLVMSSINHPQQNKRCLLVEMVEIGQLTI